MFGALAVSVAFVEMSQVAVVLIEAEDVVD